MPSLCPEKGNVDEVQHALWRLTVAVDDLVQQVVGVLLRADGGHAAVQIHPFLPPGDVIFVHVGGDVQVGGTFRRLGGFALFLQNRLVQQLEVHVVAHAGHVAGLLGAQKVARAPDLQIPHGNFEAGAEFGKIPDGGKPLFGDFGEILFRAVGEIGVGVAGGAPYPAAKLMELAQAKSVGIFDDEGVGVGDVQTRFNDGGAYQHLDFALCHGLHHIPQGVLTHLAVGDAHADARNPALDRGGALVDGFRAVVEVIDLPAPLNFPADGIVNDGLAVLHHEGLHGIAVGGGLLDGGHVPDAGQRHVQRPGNGSGGEGQYVHSLGNFLQAFLMADAEALLLVHDE